MSPPRIAALLLATSVLTTARDCTSKATSHPATDSIVEDTAASAGDLNIHFPQGLNICESVSGGFSPVPGSFVAVSVGTLNLLRLGETLTARAEYGVRRRRIELKLARESFFAKPIEAGVMVYDQRFNYNQGVESSIMAFQRDLTDLTYGTTDAINYVAYSRGVVAFARYRWRAIRAGLRYSYDISDFTTLNEGTTDFFQNLEYRQSYSTNPLSGIRTSTITPSFSYNTVNNPLQPTQGTSVDVSLAIAGLGGDVNTLEPMVEAKHFRAGFLPRHVIAVHLRAGMTYGGNGVPPVDRYYMGGENELRGFSSWSIGPLAYFPSTTVVGLLNNDGTPREQRVIINGNPTFVNATVTVPIYRPLSVGGDTKLAANAEYRIPIKGPFSATLFLDAGVNRLTFPNQLRVVQQRVASLDYEFPEAAFGDRPISQPGTQKIRMSTGTEWLYWLPKVNAPLRFDIAYNPLVYRAVLQPPTVDSYQSYFQNAATYFAALTQGGLGDIYRERRFMFRFSIGRTF